MVLLNQGGNYLKVDDVKDGDVLNILDEGTWVESKYTYDDGNPKQDFVLKVQLRSSEYSVRVNKYSRDEIIPYFGNDTSKWVGRQLMVKIEEYRSLKKKGIILLPVVSGEEAGKAGEGWT